MAQWLRICLPVQQTQALIPGWETKILSAGGQLSPCKQRLSSKPPGDAPVLRNKGPVQPKQSKQGNTASFWLSFHLGRELWKS